MDTLSIRLYTANNVSPPSIKAEESPEIHHSPVYPTTSATMISHEMRVSQSATISSNPQTSMSVTSTLADSTQNDVLQMMLKSEKSLQPPKKHQSSLQPHKPERKVLNIKCRVCGDSASGIHFGIYTCEGCKLFFLRATTGKIKKMECRNNNQCAISRESRTACRSCRYELCKKMGMSSTAVRMGRHAREVRFFKKMASCNSEDSNEVEESARPSLPLGAGEVYLEGIREKISEVIAAYSSFNESEKLLVRAVIDCYVEKNSRNQEYIDMEAKIADDVELFQSRYVHIVRTYVQFLNNNPFFDNLTVDQLKRLINAAGGVLMFDMYFHMFDRNSGRLRIKIPAMDYQSGVYVSMVNTILVLDLLRLSVEETALVFSYLVSYIASEQRVFSTTDMFNGRLAALHNLVKKVFIISNRSEVFQQLPELCQQIVKLNSDWQKSMCQSINDDSLKHI